MIALVSTLVWLVLAGGQAPQSAAPQEPPAGTASIRGQVTEKEGGRPIARAVVRLLPRGGADALTTLTDDEGRYEFTRLNAGAYFGFVDDGRNRAIHITGHLRAPGGGSITLRAGDALKDVDVALVRALAVTVHVVDEWGEPLSNLAVTVKSAVNGAQTHSFSPRTTDDRGLLRIFMLAPGRYSVCAEAGASPVVQAGSVSQRERLVRTCYPSAADESQAEPVTLEGADVDGLEIVMRRTRTYSISGILLDATGAPAANTGVGFAHQFGNGGGSTFQTAGADGRFVFGNIPPGDYAIEANVGGPERPAERREPQAAYQPVHVGSADIDGLVVAMARTVDLAGRFVLEDPAARLPRAEGSGLLIWARLSGDEPSRDGSLRSAIVGDDRVFRFTGLFGRRTLEFANVPRGWYVKSARYAGREIIDTPTEFKAGSDPAALEVVLSTRGAVVTGRALDDAGNPVAGARVLLVEAERARRPSFLQTAGATAADGTFRTGPHRAGDYLVVAIERNVEPPRREDRDRMAALLAGAERITLLADEERALDVHVSKPK